MWLFENDGFIIRALTGLFAGRFTRHLIEGGKGTNLSVLNAYSAGEEESKNGALKGEGEVEDLGGKRRGAGLHSLSCLSGKTSNRCGSNANKQIRDKIRGLKKRK